MSRKQRRQERMTTPAQAAASKANSLHSTGPRTPEGKAQMRNNPLRHGLTSTHLIIAGEKQEDFDALIDELRRDYRPVGQDENRLLSEVAEHQWRLARARRTETATLNLYVERLLDEAKGDHDRALALAFEKYGKELGRIHRYETTISRAFHKALKDLEARQYQRRRMEALLAMQESKRRLVGSVSQNFSETQEMPVSDSPEAHEEEQDADLTRFEGIQIAA